MFLQEDEERVCGNSSLCRTGSDCTAPSARAVPSALTGLCCGGGGREKLRERAARKYPVFIVSYHSHPLYQSPHIRSRISLISSVAGPPSDIKGGTQGSL